MPEIEQTIPKPWDHRILVRPQTEDAPEGALIAYCTCGEYTRQYSTNMDALIAVKDSTDHLTSHPLKPLSIVQVGEDGSNGDVLLVMGVPGMGGEETVHMTVAVSADIYDDNVALAKWLGPIGSPVHYGAEQQRRFEQEHRGQVKIIGDAQEIPGGLQGLLGFLQGLPQQGQQEGDNDDTHSH
jgi:hypothetical protein